MSELKVETLTQIAHETRRDFLAGKITIPHLVEIALINRPGLTEEEKKYIDTDAAAGLINFPDEGCQVATDELFHRVGYGEIVDGNYQVTGQGELDGPWRHVFLDAGKTEIADHTIVDITADQFGGPAVYVGKWDLPWSSRSVVLS